MPYHNDPEGKRLPAGIDRAMDGHVHVFPDRIIYGSDYLPYAWDRELKWLAGSSLSPEDLDQVLYKSGAEFFGI